ncbi:MAG: hypothetical protein EXS13_12575 [Planctomycetes bacterium]|nr:hypothetical protein [Planctomycetota bacterium]
MGRCDPRSRRALRLGTAVKLTPALTRPLTLVLALACAATGCVGSDPTAERTRVAVDSLAGWLDAHSVATASGRKTPCDLYSGTAGVALFFAEAALRSDDELLRLFHAISRDAALGELGAALFAAESIAPDSALDAGLYTGLAGIGATFLEIGRLRGDAALIENARRCARVLQRKAQVAGHGVEWSDTTDVIGGGAGIGLFLIALHEQTGDRTALDLARSAGRRLVELSIREPVGRSWRMNPDFPRVMPNFSHGTAGIALFLARLAQVSCAAGFSEAFFLDAASDGADHLLSIADRSEGGLRIHHHTPDGTDLWYLGWCHGPPGTARLFAQLAMQTGDARYAGAARDATTTLLTANLPAPQPGFWSNVGQCCGSAGVIEHLVDTAREARGGDAARASACLALARKLADDLLARAIAAEGGLSFPHAEHRTRPDLVVAQSGYMQGAAGIGLALLHLAAAEEDGAAPEADPLAVRLPDALPLATLLGASGDSGRVRGAGGFDRASGQR